jgi:hypothetical protein
MLQTGVRITLLLQGKPRAITRANFTLELVDPRGFEKMTMRRLEPPGSQ